MTRKLFSIVCVCSAAMNAWGAPQYTVTDLGSFGGDIAAVDINEDGTVVGWGVVNRFDYQMFVHDGVLSAVPPPSSSTQAQASVAGDNGEVVGVGYSMGSVVPGALVHHVGITTIVGPFTPTGTTADGRLSGVCPIAQSTSGLIIETACVLNSGAITTLSALPGGADSAAFDMSDEGWVVGGAFAAGEIRPTPVVWIGSAPLDLGTLGGTGGQAQAINANRQVAGWAGNASGQPHAFVYDLSSAGAVLARTDLGTLDGKASHARDLNDDGIAVGTSGSRAFIHRDGLMTDLNTLIHSASGWTLVDATAINNAGQIVGHGHIPGHPLRAFRLDPITCVPDLNGDGFVNLDDVTAFINAFSTGDPLADINADGFINLADVTAFIDAFIAGC